MDGWTAGEAQIVAALSRRPQTLTHLIGHLDALNADIASHEALELGLRRLIAADYVAVSARGFTLTPCGRAIRRRGSRGVGSSRLLHQGITRELVAAGPPPAPAAWSLSEQEYETTSTDYHERMERFTRWFGMTWRDRVRHVLRGRS